MPKRTEIGSLILRVVLGVIFFAHGFVKFQDGIGNTVTWFESIGLPGFLAYGTASVEIVAGIALIIGFGTRIFSLLIALIMIGSIFQVKWSAGFIDGYEFDLALLAMAVYFALSGSKFVSVDQLMSSNTQHK